MQVSIGDLMPALVYSQIRTGISHIAALPVALTVFFLTDGALAETPPATIRVVDAAARCVALSGSTVPASAIGLPTRGALIESALLQPKDGVSGLPEYCQVKGAILAASPADPDIKFQLNLPTDWNVKTLQFGGGGYNGVVITGLGRVSNAPVTSMPPLALGYATFGSDSGNQQRNGAYGTNNQALANYGGEAVKRLKDVAVILESGYYGRLPWKVYYQGGSKGGHEGLVAAQRYGSDYDGVIAYYPANQNQAMVLSWNRIWQATYRVSGAYLNPAKQVLLKARVLATCDGLDGAQDGLVSNVKGCEAAFSVNSLRCAGGADSGDHCLSDAQVGALQAAGTPMRFEFPLANGVASIGPYPVYIGGDLSPWLDATGFGTGTPYYGFVSGVLRYFDQQDEKAPVDTFDYRQWQPRVQYLSAVLDATDPVLDIFKQKTAKMLLVQGTTDMLVTHTMTTAYYEQLAARYGASLPDFVRYYVVPGFAHGGGDFKSTWDSLSALEAWAERSIPPQNQVVMDANTTNGGRTRPLCEYPAYPKYLGNGDINSATSFTCSRN